MKPNSSWINDWRVGVNLKIERRLSRELLKIFEAFWIQQDLDDKSKTTKSRYSNALHALGGHIIEKSPNFGNENITAYEIIFEYIGPDEGPMFYPDNEDWQREVDMVCRKLFKYINTNR